MPIFSHSFSGFFLKRMHPEPKPEPTVLRDSLGTFALDKGNYEGAVKLLGHEVTVFLEPDGNGRTTADGALRSLHIFAETADGWDARIKKFAADDFAEKDGSIETWGGCDSDSEGETIFKEEVMRRIELNFIQFYSDGSLFLDYSLDDMFTDHGLGVHADISGKIESCALWG